MFARRGGLLLIAYLVIGVLVAAAKNYLDIDNIRDLISAALGIALWPLLLLGINLHIGKLNGEDGKKSLLLPAVMRQADSLLRHVSDRFRRGASGTT